MKLSPARLVVRVKNNRLIATREELGFKTAKSASVAANVAYQEWVLFENLRKSAFLESGSPRPVAREIAGFLGVDLDWLFAADGIDCRPVVIPFTPQVMLRVPAEQRDPIEGIVQSDLIDRALCAMTERTRLMVERYFGVGSFSGQEPQTYQEIAEWCGMSRERVRQLICVGTTAARHALHFEVEDAA